MCLDWNLVTADLYLAWIDAVDRITLPFITFHVPHGPISNGRQQKQGKSSINGYIGRLDIMSTYHTHDLVNFVSIPFRADLHENYVAS